jgi:15-cis-phytoene synthase
MSLPAAEREAAGFCAELVRAHDFPRYASALFVPTPRRRALLALYAFNVEICRVHAQVSQPLAGEVRLQWWSDALRGEGHGGIEGNPVAAELLLAMRSYRLSTERLSRLIEEHQFDLYDDPMPTLAALEAYLYDTSSALFSLAAAVMGPPENEVEQLARHAGLAQGIAQVMTSLPLHVPQRRLFVPLQILADHGCGAEDFFAGKETPKLRAAVDELLGEARIHLNTALSLLSAVPPEMRVVFLPLALVRRDVEELSRADHDPFAVQSASRFKTLWRLWRASRSEKFGG